jgi:hypothetical protein
VTPNPDLADVDLYRSVSYQQRLKGGQQHDGHLDPQILEI